MTTHTPGPHKSLHGIGISETVFYKNGVPQTIAQFSDKNSSVRQADADFYAASPDLETALMNLLEWAKGNRGNKRVNPYGVPEVKAALKVLARIQGVSDWMHADTKGGAQ